MSNPSEIFNRIRQRQSAPAQPANAPRIPAPAPAHGLPPVAPPVSDIQPGRQNIRVPADAPGQSAEPRSTGSHTLYRQLMRSHDRMGTRHLKRNG